MRFLPFYFDAIAARQRSCIFLYRTFTMHMATNTTQISRGLFAVGPDMTEVLAVVALCKTGLSSV
jgi:hypothetical protein